MKTNLWSNHAQILKRSWISHVWAVVRRPSVCLETFHMLIFFSRIPLAIYSPNFPTKHSLCLYSNEVYSREGSCHFPRGYNSEQRRIQRRRAGRPPPPPFLKFLLVYVWKFWLHNTQFNFIVINMQCLQYVFYSLFSLQKHRVCLKGYQNNLQTSKTIPRRDRPPPPGSLIFGSAPGEEVKIFFFRTTGPISSKVIAKQLWVKEFFLV